MSFKAAFTTYPTFNDTDIATPGLATGDFIVFFVFTNHYDGGPPSTWPIDAHSDIANPDPNLTFQVFNGDSGANSQAWVYTYVVGATVPTQFHFSPQFESSWTLALCYTSIDPVSPLAAAITSFAGNTITPTAASQTPSVAALLVYAYLGNNAAVATPPSGFTTRVDGATYENLFFRQGAYDFQQPSSGATGSISSTLNMAGDNVTFLVALTPLTSTPPVCAVVALTYI